MTAGTHPRSGAAGTLKVNSSNHTLPAGTETATVLIGTAGTIAELRAQLGAAGAEASAFPGVVIGSQTEVGTAIARALDVAGVAPSGGGRPGVRQAIVSLPEDLGELRHRVVQRLRELGIAARLATPAVDLLAPAGTGASGGTHWRAAPTIDLGELIGRKPHELDRGAIARVLGGKRVLITGAGGSIGAHLAQVVAEFAPESVILMERAENALFEVDRQLGRRFPSVGRRALLHDVVDAEQTARHLAALRPHVVFHAAAHKHVPLMEDHPAHAVANNLLGTKAIADAAVACGAERFVMISSDKAVNPTSVMGATKRLAELYVRWLGAGQERTRMSMVRFGNVLGSACSVLTIWSTQIAEGGPVTVTDPRMTRYFMTIPEAAALVIASTTLQEHASGAVYVLEMGEPIRIVDLARRFVAAHGMRARVTPGEPDAAGEPNRAGPVMDVVFTGVRPGEKIHEELAYAAENLLPTRHPGIRAWSGLALAGDGATHSDALRPSRTGIEQMVRDLRRACATRDPAAVIEEIQRHVPEMQRRAGAAAA